MFQIQNNSGNSSTQEWPSGLSHCDWIGKFQIQTPLGAQSGLWIQPGYNAPGEPWGKKIDKTVISIR